MSVFSNSIERLLDVDDVVADLSLVFEVTIWLVMLFVLINDVCSSDNSDSICRIIRFRKHHFDRKADQSDCAVMAIACISFL